MTSRSTGFFRFGLTAAVLAASVVPVAAQQGSAPRAELRGILSSLSDSAALRVSAPGLVVTDGVFLGLSRDSLRVVEADVELLVGLDEVESLSVRESRWFAMAWKSAAVGTVVGLTAGFFYGTKECGFEAAGCDEKAAGYSVRWGLSMGAVSGILGALVGSRFTRWASVWP